MINKKVFAWGLYDFANSLIIANLTLYFSQWLIINNHLDDIWYGGAIAVSTLALILTAPFFGKYSDQTNSRMRLIIPLTIFLFLATFLLGIFGASSLSFWPKVAISLMLFFIIQYTYQLSLIFYDTLLAQISKAKNFGQISGFGEAMGNLGFLVGLFLTLPFINGTITLFGTPGRIQAFIPSAIGFGLLSLPMIFFIKDPPLAKVSFSSDPSQFFKEMKALLKNRTIFLFLLAFYFFSDAILTIQAFFPIYFEKVLGFSDTQKIIATALTFILIVIGAFIIGKVSDQLGIKKSLILSTLALTLLFMIFPLISAGGTVWLMLGIIGFFWGGFYATSRAFLTHLAPKKSRSQFFSLYTIFRRFASVIGPVLWGITTLLLSPYGVNKYRLSVYPLIFLMILGVFLFTKVSNSKTN